MNNMDLKNYKEIEILRGKKSVALIGHIEPDADALCSMSVFRDFLIKNFNVSCVDIFAECKIIPAFASQILENLKINQAVDKKYDVAITMDSSNLERTGIYSQIFENAKTKIVIDHHATNKSYGNINYVEICSSTCEIVYKILKSYDYKFTASDYSKIYSGIITDTNNFAVGNMSSVTFKIAGECYDHIDHEKIYNTFFSSNTLKNMRLLSIAINNISSFENGKIILTKISFDEANRYSATTEDFNGIINRLNTIAGCKMICFVEPRGESYYVSMRSKTGYDVSKVAKKFGGGGHVCAAAYLSNKSIEKIEEEVYQEFLNQVK